MVPTDVPNPFKVLAGEAGKIIADGWTVAMLGLWNAGLWVFRLVLRFVDSLTTPDLTEFGPAAAVYQVTFWLAGALVLILVMVQLGVAAIRRDAKSLATVFLGLGKFVVVWAGWVSYGVAVVAACGGLTRALMMSLLKVSSWSAWQPWASFTVQDGVDGTVATVLGLLGLLLWLAAIGHLLVMLTRGGALMVLVATAPISAAGLVGDAGRSWFWKSLRWFHAAAFTPVLMVVVLGVGVQLTTGVANGLADHTQAAIGTALPGVVMILIGCFAPLALFKLLAFVEPGTSSGAALRSGLAAHGGLQGLLTGPGSSTATGASTATGSSTTATGGDGRGRSQGESAGEDSTAARFTHAQAGFLRQAGGGLGGVTAKGLGVMQQVGAAGAAISADLTNQMGVGHTSYHPDFSGPGGVFGPPGTRRTPDRNGQPSTTPDSDDDAGTPRPADEATPRPNTPHPPTGSAPSPPTPPPSPPSSPSTPGPRAGSTQTSPGPGTPTGAAGGAGAAGGEAAAAVPIVPV